MKRFFRRYWLIMKDLFKEPLLYGIFLLIIMGGHSPVGKVLAMIGTIIVVPLFRMWYARMINL